MGTANDGHHGETPAGGHPPAKHEGQSPAKHDVPHQTKQSGDKHHDGAHHEGSGQDMAHTVWGKMAKPTSPAPHGEGDKHQGQQGAKHLDQQAGKPQAQQSAKHLDQQTGKPHPPNENAISRFLLHPLDESVRVYKELVAHAKIDAPAHPHLDKLKPAERAQQHIRECDAHGKTFHYDDHGRIASVSGKDKPTVIVAYDKSGHPDGVKVFKADGQMQARYEHQAHVELRINQTTGDVVATQKSMFKAEDARADVKDVPSIKEERITADGVKTVLNRDLKGQRLEFSVYAPDERRASRTKYHYTQPDATNHGDTTVTAAEYRGDGHTLHREYVYEKPQSLEKNDPSVRIDHSYPPDKPGRFVEQTRTYDLHHDKKNPIAASERVNDFNTGVTTIDQSSFAGGKQTEKKHFTVDEMGRTTSLKMDRDHLHVEVKFNKNGTPQSVSGDKAGHTDKELLQSAEMLVLINKRSGQITGMAHEQLLAYRGPTQPRDGKAPTGDLVYMKDGHFVEQKVVLGEIKVDGKVIGHANDKGQVEINGESFNIISDPGFKAAFTGLGTDGRYLDLTQGQGLKGGERKEGFSGCVTNGHDTKIVLGGHMFNSDSNNFFGQFDNQGKVKFSQALDQKENDNTCLSAVLKNGYQFHGNDCGNSRDFSLDRTSHGSIDLDVDGKKQPCEVQLGMLIDPTTKKQLGNYKPPTMSADGSFNEGEVLLNGQVQKLSSLTNTSFRVTVDGQDKEMHGFVLGALEVQADGTTRPNKGGIVDLDAYLGGAKADCVSKLKDLTEAQAGLKALKDAQQYSDPDGGGYTDYADQIRMQQEVATKQKAYDDASTRLTADQAAIDKSAGGIMEAQTLGRLKDFINTDPLSKANSSFSSDPKSRLDLLKAAIDKPDHVLEKFEKGAKMDGDMMAIDPSHPDQKLPCTIDKNVIYDKSHHEAIGSLDPNSGMIRLFSANGQSFTMSMADRSMSGSVIHMTGNSEGGKPITVDWINDGQNRLHSADQERKQVALERGYATLLAANAESGPPFEMLKRTKELEQRYLKALDDTVANRAADGTNIDGVSVLEMLRGGPRDFVRAEQNRDGRHYTGGRIDVPVMDDAACQKSGGPMRIGNGHFFADNGKIYKMSLKSHELHLKLDLIGLDKTFNTAGWVRSDESCGYLKPGYVAHIDGHDINLQNDPNFLFQLKVGDDPNEHLIMGLGEPHRDAGGRLVAGGLVDARELLRQTGDSQHKVDLAVKDYKDNETLLLGIGTATDRSIGGREGVLDHIQNVASIEQGDINSRVEQTFYQGLHGHTLATQDIDRNLRSVQNMMRDMNLSATDANDMAVQGKNFQSGVREGAALVVTTLASGGTSLAVQGGWLSFRAGLGVATLSGGLGTAIVKQTRGGDRIDFASNFSSGGMETLLMFTGGNIGQSAKNFSAVSKEAGLVNVIRDGEQLEKLQQFARQGKLYENLEEMANLKKLGGLAKPTTAAMQELAANPRAMELVDMIAKESKTSVKAFCDLIKDKKAVSVLKAAAGKPVEVVDKVTKAVTVEESLSKAQRKIDIVGKLGSVTNAYYQSTGFSLINSARNYNPEAPSELTGEKLLWGGAYMLGGEMIGSLTHLPVGKRFNLGEKGFGHFVDTMISSYPDAVINNSVFSALTARANAGEVERENIAYLLKTTKDMVSADLYEMYKDEGRINSYIFDQTVQGAMTASFSHPFTHAVTHFLGVRTEERNQEEWTSSLKAQKNELHQQQMAAIEAKVDALPMEDLASYRSHVVKNADGTHTRLLKDGNGELTQVSLPDGTAITRRGDHWIANKISQEYSGVKTVKVDDSGNISLEKIDQSRLTLHPDGRVSEHRILAPGHEQDRVTRRDGQISVVDRADGKVTAVRVEKPKSDQPGAPAAVSETKISYDQHGKPDKVEIAAGSELIRDQSGWSLHINGEKVRDNAFHDVRVLDDGTIIKERRAGQGQASLSITEHPDGSKLTLKGGKVQFTENKFGMESKFVHDAQGRLSKVTNSSGETFRKEGDGWVCSYPGQPDRQFKEVSVDQEGRVRTVDQFEISREFALDGRFAIRAPGDPVGPVNYKVEKERFDQLLAKVDNPAARRHIDEGLLDLQDRLRATNKEHEKVLGDVLYDVNEMLSKKGHFDAAEVPKLIDEALSIAANPELLSQGGFGTCMVTASQQREFALHPDTMFRTLRRLHDSERIVGANGDSIPFDVNGTTALPDGDARSHYSEDGRTRADGARMRVSQVLQQAFCDIISKQHPERKPEDGYYANDIEPMMAFITGRREHFVVQNPTDARDFCEKLLDIKKNGDLYAIVQMDAQHIGARGFLQEGGHVRIVKDIRSPLEAEDKIGGQSLRERFDADGNAISNGRLDIDRMVIDFGNTWSRSASHETLTPEEAYHTTVIGRSDENLQGLVERLRANPTDPFERLELTAWKVGFLDGAVDRRLEKKVDLFAEDALNQLCGSNKVRATELISEVENCKKDICAEILKRDPALAGDVDRILAGRPEEQALPKLVDEGKAVNLDPDKATLTYSEREYLKQLRSIEGTANRLRVKEEAVDRQATALPGAQPAEELQGPGRVGVNDRVQNNEDAMAQVHRLLDASRNLRALRSGGEDDLRAAGSLDLARKYRLKDSAYESASTVDNVTGYANYKGTKRWLETIIEQLKKDPSKELHFISIDVRKFKNANNEMGKEGGDDALRLITKHLAKELGLRPDELVARHGGDELSFALLCPKAKVAGVVEKIESTYLACRGYDKEKEGPRKYGMKFESADHVRDVESGKIKGKELIIYPVAGAVTYHAGDSAEHLMERADALMTKRKTIDDVIVKEKAELRKNGQSLSDLKTKQIHAFDPDFKVQKRKGDRHGQPDIDMSGAPRLTTEDIKNYSSLTAEQKTVEQHKLQARIDDGRTKISDLHQELLRQNEVLKKRELSAHKEMGDAAVTTASRDEIRGQLGTIRGEVSYQRRLKEDMQTYDSLPASERAHFMETIDSLRDLYKNRAEQYQEAFRNPHTKRENREMCDRALLRALDTAEANKNHPGFQPFSVFMVDINNMKPVNDAKGLGHDAGNDLLSHAGAYLKDHLPPGCQCFSPSGGSFVIIAPNPESRKLVEAALKQYGTDPHTGATRGFEVESPYVPKIDMTKIEGSSKLKFGFSYGESNYDPSKIGDKLKEPQSSGPNTNVSELDSKAVNSRTEARHALYVTVINEMKAAAENKLNADKQAHIDDGSLMPRLPMEVYDELAPSPDYNEWSVTVKDRSQGADWQRPRDTESVVADFRKHMQDAAADRKNRSASTPNEPLNQRRVGHGQNSGDEPDDLLSSTLRGLNLSDRTNHGDLDDDEPQLNFKEHALIPDNYLNPAPETDGNNRPGPMPSGPDDGQNGGNQRTTGNASRRDAAAGDGTRMMSENELADMPQKSGGPSPENPIKAQPLPYEVHAQNEALRLQRNADSQKVFSKQEPQSPEAVQAPAEKVDSKPVSADKLSGEFQERFKDDRADLTRILSDQVWCLRPAVDSRTMEEFSAIESRKAQFAPLRAEVYERLVNSGNIDDVRPIPRGKLGDEAFVRDKISSRPEELKLYEEYLAARHRLEASDKAAEPMKARLADLQNIVDRFCQKNGLPKTNLEISHDEQITGRVLESGTIQVSRAELIEERPSPELLSLLCDGVQYGRESRTDDASARKVDEVALQKNVLEHNNPGRMVDDQNSLARDILLYGQLRADDHACFKDNNLRDFIVGMRDCVKEWKPLDPSLSDKEKDAVVKHRGEQLVKALGEFLEPLGYFAPGIKIIGDAEADATDTKATYKLGCGVCEFRRSRFENPDAEFFGEIAHEVIGHAIQDQLVTKVSLLNRLREQGFTSVDDIGTVPLDSNGQPVLGPDPKRAEFIKTTLEDCLFDPAVTVRHKTSKMEVAFLNDVLKQSHDWINERLAEPSGVLAIDPECVRARRLIVNFQAPREEVDSNATPRSAPDFERPEDVRLRVLKNVLAGRALDAQSGIDDKALLGELLQIGKPLPAGTDPKDLMKNLVESVEVRKQYFGYDPLAKEFFENNKDAKPDQVNNKIDKLFKDLLVNPEFLAKCPDFFEKLVHCNSTSDMAKRDQLRNDWVKMIRDEYPEQIIGKISSAKLQTRLDFLAYELLFKHFDSPAATPLGSLTKPEFDRRASIMVAQLLRDNYVSADLHNHLLYRANFYEVEPHFIQYRVRELMAGNDLAHSKSNDSMTPNQTEKSERLDRLSMVGKKLQPAPDPAYGALSLLPAGHQDEVAAPAKAVRPISLLFSKDQPAQLGDGSGDSNAANRASWKSAVEAYKRMDPNAERDKAEEAQYQNLQNKLEAEVRRQLGDLHKYMNPPADGKTSRHQDGYDLGSRYRSTDNSEGKAQQEAFFKRLSKSLNTYLLSDPKIAEKPEVLARDTQLVSAIKGEMAASLQNEAAQLMQRGVKQPEAEQRALINTIKRVHDGMGDKEHGDYTPVEKALDKAIDSALERGRDWIGMPIPDGCVLDQLGCDYLLVNKRTGEYYPIDVTVKGHNKSSRLVDCQALNENLSWLPPAGPGDKYGKHVPRDRERFVMVVADDNGWNEAVSLKRSLIGGDVGKAEKGLESDASDSVATAMLATLQTPSRLNLFDQPLPPLDVNLNRAQRVGAAKEFVKQLRAVGMDSWARDLEGRLISGHLRSRP